MKYILFTDGILSARYDSDINTTIPADAVEVSDHVFFQTINETDGIWSLVNGKIVKLPFPAPTQEELAQIIRNQRDLLISQSDFTQLPDAPFTTYEKTAWKTYRQALRDVTEQATFPDSVEWPVKP